MRENYTAATVKDLPAPPPVENIRNKKCQVSLCVPGHVPAQVISSFFSPLEVLFPDNSSRSIQTQTVPCDMSTIVLLAPEEQHPEQETNVQPDVEPSPPSARPKKMRQQGMFQCLYPGYTKSFTRKHDLTRHEGQHEGDVFKCEMCPSEFTFKKNLAKYLKSHQDGFICQVCGAKMSSAQPLQSLLNVHSQEKPYKCENEGCSKGSTSVTALRKHQKGCGLSIEEKKNIQCPECTIKVSTKDSLKYHLKDIHSNPQSFVCQGCGKAMNSCGAYKKHVCATE